jgi:GT2 family glycosyltransferase
VEGVPVTQPWLSVIIPTYNGAAHLPATLRSIEIQTRSASEGTLAGASGLSRSRQGQDGLEIIAVDDGSSDATVAILEEHARRLPLRVCLRGRVGSWVANTNYGLSVARGDYACFLHQDDVWLPGRLGVLRPLVAREPGAALFLHPTQYIDDAGRRVGLWRCPLRPGRQSSEQLLERLLVQNFIATPAPLFARAAALGAGGLDEALWYTADWDFWLRLAAAGPAVYHPRPLAAFRIHRLSQTAQGVARADEMRRQMECVLDRHLGPWEAAHPGRGEVGRAARLSAAVNHALASCAHGRRPNWGALLGRFFGLGPGGWWRFLRDSRIVERVAARLRAGLRPAPRAGGQESGGAGVSPVLDSRDGCPTEVCPLALSPPPAGPEPAAGLTVALS